MSQAADADFRSAVEAARMGAIFATDQRQYNRWASRSQPKTRLADDAIERAIVNIARQFPDNVIRGTV